MNGLTHFDTKGQAIMVDVSEKQETERIAIAKGRLKVGKEVFEIISKGNSKKGDVLGVARVAGIMATKKTSELIPMCHPLMISKATVDFVMDEDVYEVEATCTVKLVGRTGVEMEALTGATTALLTIYDMCKAIDKGMEIRNVYLETKAGGKGGTYQRTCKE